MDSVLKFVQILFYLTAGFVAILTYIKAKSGLLNTINTEYHKKVIDRLSALSEDLFSEFDHESDNYWARSDLSGEIISRIHDQVDNLKHEIISKKVSAREVSGIPIPELLIKLEAQLNRIRSDPFIPNKIRDITATYLSDRVESLREAVMEESEKYLIGLSEGKYWESKAENKHWFHNNLMENIRGSGFGVLETEKRVTEIRDAIREYFESYNPIAM
ncbi:ABC-type multidrug transport system fused ATPase/permease subunit [Parvibaculum indicum]|uniref:hypothetical protein n=1 Tax=Parvibaculum indicum TaxID=562969 RepID=UPI00141F4E42|nr:hypothetical protein [Parvibaculum indicum]NIJ42098.1 ABC-type multidrug transport system fused ATPase/permease subunit [Parvibaculum indicum]